MSTEKEDEDDAIDGRYLELFAAFGSGGATGEPSRPYSLKWISPADLLVIANDLLDADERGGDSEDVMRAWAELWEPGG